MGPIPEGARHAPATRRERAAALAAHACADDGDALGPGGWKPAAGDPTAGERARPLPDHRAGGLRTTAPGRLDRKSVGQGKSVSLRVTLRVSSLIPKKHRNEPHNS